MLMKGTMYTLKVLFLFNYYAVFSCSDEFSVPYFVFYVYL